MFCSIVRYKLYYSPAQDAGKAYDLCGAPVERLGELHGHTAAEPGGEFQLQLAIGGPHRGQCLAVCIGVIAFIAGERQRDGLGLGGKVLRGKGNAQAGALVIRYVRASAL